MTNEAFLKHLEQYKSILRRETFEQLVLKVRQNQLDDQAKQVLLAEMEASQKQLNLLSEAEAEQTAIYQEGVETLNALQKEATNEYKKIMRQAEAENQKEEQAEAEKTLINLTN